MILRIPIAVIIIILISWAYISLKPPEPKVCGSSGGAPVTSPRVKLSDGRYLAYKEGGVPKENAAYKIILCHGFDDSKDMILPISQDLIEELRIYFLSYDRAGYGESDPHPKRSVKSEAFDIQELADILQIGKKFYVIGISMGAYPVWSCLNYIPHRLAGAALVVPFVNYWWPFLPASLAKEALSSQLLQDQLTFRVAHYAPSLFYWWKTRTWLPSGIMEGNKAIFTCSDLDILNKYADISKVNKDKIRQQGVYESLYRDVIVGFSNWKFDLLGVQNPFSKNEGSVHIWQGRDDKINPYKINRYISEKLPWIRYHEVPDAGHLIFMNSSVFEAIVTDLLYVPTI